MVDSFANEDEFEKQLNYLRQAKALAHMEAKAQRTS